MTIKYDIEADAAYVRLKEDEAAVSIRELSDVCVLDLDAGGEVVGIELLSVFGFAGSALAQVAEQGLISRSKVNEIMEALRSEVVAA